MTAAGDIAALLKQGMAHHGAGRLADAETFYRRILAAQPNHADALHLLGDLARRKGARETAADLIGRAIAARPEAAEFHNTLGVVLRDMDRVADAEAAYRRAVALDPAFVAARTNLANVLRQQGKAEEALALLHELLAGQQGNASVYNSLGNALAELERYDEAAAAFRRALALNDRFPQAHNNLANVLVKQGQLREAAASYRRALALQPDFVDTLNNLVGVLIDLDELNEATEIARRATDLKPNSAEAWDNLGNALRSRGRFEQAAACFERAMALDPASWKAACDFASTIVTLCDHDRIDRVTETLSRMLADRPNWPKTWANFASIVYRFSFLPFEPTLYRTALDGVAATFTRDYPPLAPRPTAAARDKIRIGYVSPCYGDHPVGHVTRRLYAAHDRGDFEVILFSTVDRSADPGPYHADIRAGADEFVDLAGLPHEAAARRVADHGIDILVDLNGFMRDMRTEIFAHRPAPAQVFWLGHAGGLGLPFIDYLIADAVVVPPGDEAIYRERVVRLPEVYHPTDTPDIPDRPLRRADFGLADGAFVFCAFNNPEKIDRRSFAAWMRILARVPGSQLWLSRLVSPPAMERNLRAAAEAAGVDPDRLVFAERLPDKATHLARHRLADLFLDTFAVNAATTMIDALWAGLPPVTLYGDSFAGRMGATLMTAAGLADMVCRTAENYEDRAVALASDKASLATLAGRLAANRASAPLFDIDRFTRHLEDAYRGIWRRAAAGQPPEGFDVPARP